MAAVLEVRRVDCAPGAAATRSGGWLLTGAIALVPVAVSIVIAVAGGAWGIARTDDWAFARIAFDFHHTAQIHLVGWAQMNLVGLIGYVQPWLWLFGDHVWVLDLAGAALVAGGLAAAHRVARRVLTPGLAGIAVASVIVFPGFLRDMSTFMTDAPAFAAQAIVLAVGLAALDAKGRRKTWLLGATVVLGLWAFSIREFAIAAPLGVLGAAYSAAPKQERRRIGAAAVGLLVAGGALYLWRTGLPGQQHVTADRNLTVTAVMVSRLLSTTALGLLPILVWTIRRWWQPVSVRARRLGCAAGAIVLVVTVALSHTANNVLIGRYLDPRGVDGGVDLVGRRPVLLPAAVWTGLTVAAAVATVALAGLLAEWVATRPPKFDVRRRALAVHVAISVAACGAAALLNGYLFDRYLWPVMLSLSVLVLARFPVSRGVPRRAAGIAFAVAGALTLAIAANSAAYDGARWHAAVALTHEGVPAQAVDGGFEWAGAHTTAPADTSGKYHVAQDDPSAWWRDWFPHSATCSIVSASPIKAPGYVLTSSPRWNLLLVAVPEHLSVYRAVSC